MGVMMAINQMIGRGATWPPPAVSDRWAEIELFAAFRLSNETRIRQEASVRWAQRYMLSPVPRMISRASANMLYGEPAEITAASPNDQANLDRLIAENDLAAEAHRGAMISSSEGEVWGRIVVAPDLLDVPIIDFVSADRVIPHFSGRFVTGATFVTEWATGSTECYRLLETYGPGYVLSELYRGSTTQLGTEVDLEKFQHTGGRQRQVNTGIDWPLAAFIPNTIDADPCRGYSDYAGLKDRFLALNEAGTVGQANLRLAGRKRAMVDAGYLGRRGTVPDGDDVFVCTSREGGDGASIAPLQVIDYQFQADQTIAWIDHLIDSTLTFAGLSPQSVGRSVDGGAISGTAMKLKMSHSLLEAAGKGRYFDRGLARLLRGAQILDGRPTTEGGFGRTYTSRDLAPSIQRQDGLPRDDTEATSQLVSMAAADAISLEERVAFLHPEWTEDQQREEVDRLKAEHQLPDLPVP